jgi:hypothetical protein
MPIVRTFIELQKYKSFDERYNYLRLVGIVGETTFGFDRVLNQILYKSRMWSKSRDYVIVRDNGCDLASKDYQIRGRIIIHHMNPISIEDILNENDNVYDPRYLICTSHKTHLAIHFGDQSLLPQIPIIRRPWDTCPWR